MNKEEKLEDQLGSDIYHGAGLTPVGVNEEGEKEFIGTDAQWQQADDDIKAGKEENMSACCYAPMGDTGFCSSCKEHSVPEKINYQCDSFSEFMHLNCFLDEDEAREMWDENLTQE